MNMPTISIRNQQGSSLVTVDGNEFALDLMSRADRNKFRRMLIAGLEKAGYFG